ncbi:toll/interleukin-1 receptor domain-containing protein [Amycolatopsis sp. cmx-8-4]|uniref:toll/interleukin-1 receptor domain-containing protein n=1 Tax=Amycolatopsis sp. cmx-8-4 TaxID=2790947 RepID=UPI00397C3F26
MTNDETFDYDIAVSFAGEDRELVRAVVTQLKEYDIRVFFDEDSTSEMWGENLVDFLQAIYGRRARYAVLFVSQHYVSKKWTGYERQAAQDRAFQQSAPYILPVRIDDAELPGLHSTIGYVDAEFAGVQGIVDAIVRKLGDRTQARPPKYDGRAPRTPEAIAIVLSERPPGWEYLLYGGMLHQGIADLADKYRDHVIEFAPHNGTVVDDEEGLTLLSTKLTSVATIVSNIDRVLSPEAQVAAFGEPGEPGDPERIIHLASRLTSIYGELLDWSADLRAIGIADDSLRRAANAEARLADDPIRKIRQLVQIYMHGLDGISAQLLNGEDVNLTFSLKIDLDESAMDEFSSARDAYFATLRQRDDR